MPHWSESGPRGGVSDLGGGGSHRGSERRVGVEVALGEDAECRQAAHPLSAGGKANAIICDGPVLVPPSAGRGGDPDGKDQVRGSLPSPHTPRFSGILKIVLGISLLALAAKQWREALMGPHDAPAPRLAEKTSTFTPGRSAAMGIALSAINPVEPPARGRRRRPRQRAEPSRARPRAVPHSACFIVIATLGRHTDHILILIGADDKNTRSLHIDGSGTRTIMTIISLIIGAKVRWRHDHRPHWLMNNVGHGSDSGRELSDAAPPRLSIPRRDRSWKIELGAFAMDRASGHRGSGPGPRFRRRDRLRHPRRAAPDPADYPEATRSLLI